MDRRTPRRRSLRHTIENRAHEVSDEPGLLLYVHIVCDLCSLGVIGPGHALRVRHGPGGYSEGGISLQSGIKGGEGRF